MLKEVYLKQIKAEEIFRLIYLEDEIPRKFKWPMNQIIKFLRRRRKDIKRLSYEREAGNTLIHIQLDADDLSPSDLALLDEFKA